MVVIIRVPTQLTGLVFSILDEENVNKQRLTVIPYSDGELDQVVLLFSCSKAIGESCRNALIEKNIGSPNTDTDVNVLPLAVAKDLRSDQEKIEEASPDDENENKGALGVFQSTIRARIAVENMLEMVHEGAAFSFDFFMLIVVASMIACIGLITNSAVIIVASMLVSPMMGPILGFTFGTVVRDLRLVGVGLRSESLALLICVLIGFIGGLFAAPASMRQTPWPTNEMMSRGISSTLYMFVLIRLSA